MNLSNGNHDAENRDQDILDAIELLVESELPEMERHKLISQLEAEPKYWRVLAVAFMEQQSIQRSVRIGCVESKTSQDMRLHPASQIRPHDSRPQYWNHWLTFATSAAGLLLMFVLGYSVAIQKVHMESIAKNGIEQPANKHAMDPVKKVDEADENNTERVKSFPITPNLAGYVQWRQGTGTKLLPLFRGEEVDPNWLESHPLVIDKKTMESLAQSGWTANPSRHFVSIKLLDGESFTVPIDDVQYRFVGRSIY